MGQILQRWYQCINSGLLTVVMVMIYNNLKVSHIGPKEII